jgi:hypothetical protein
MARNVTIAPYGTKTGDGLGTYRSHRAAQAVLVALLLGLWPAAGRAASGVAEDAPGAFAYLHSADGGATFAPLELQDQDAPVGITHVAAEDRTVHAVFDSGDNNDAPRQIRYRRSTDGGTSFAASRRLDVLDDQGTPADGDSSESDLDAEGDHVAVAWEDDRLLPGGGVDPCCERGHPAENPADENRDDVFWSASTDGGGSFSVPRNLSDSPAVHNRDPDVALDGKLVAIVYEGEDVIGHSQTDADDILLQVSTDGGATFSGERNLTMAVGGGQAEPAVDTTGDAIHVVYRDQQEVPGTPGGGGTGDGADDSADDIGDPEEVTHLGYARLAGDGSSPSEPVLLPGPEAEFPAVIALGHTVHVVACAVADDDDPQATPDLLYWRGTDDGRATKFTGPRVLARPAGCNKPAIDGAGDDLHIAVRAEDPGLDHEVWYLRSSDGGATFGRARNVSNNPMASGDPSVSVSVDSRGKAVHLSWNDQTVFQFALRSGQRLPLDDGDDEWFDDEDVVQYTGQAYRMVIDGSDVGLAGFAIDSLARLSPFDYVLSFTEPGEIPGVGPVDDSDLVLFTATKLGGATTGKFSLWFDGSDVGLDEDGEDIDAVDVVQNLDPKTGAASTVDVYFSTADAATTAAGTSGRDEDILVCRAVTTGGDSACAGTALAFDGSAVGLSGGGEGVDAFSFDGVGPGQDDEKYSSYYSTTGDFSVDGAQGHGSDALECFHPSATPAAGEPLAECGRSAIPLLKVFDGAENFVVGNITALEFPYKA